MSHWLRASQKLKTEFKIVEWCSSLARLACCRPLFLPACHIPGGQKVKLVLAAAMWNNPHLLIMDEPTNYLDREGETKQLLALLA